MALADLKFESGSWGMLVGEVGLFVRFVYIADSGRVMDARTHLPTSCSIRFWCTTVLDHRKGRSGRNMKTDRGKRAKNHGDVWKQAALT